MAMQLTIAVLLLFTSFHIVKSITVDVAKSGAKAGGETDMKQALLSAWKEACAAKDASTVVIPKGRYLLSEAFLDGPCKAPISLQVEGTVIAPPDPSGFKDGTWIAVQKVDKFTLSGDGVFDGRGASVWGMKDASKKANSIKKKYEGTLPYNLRFFCINNSMVQGITSKDSKMFHVNVLGCKNLTFKSFSVSAPGNSVNTDGIHIGRSTGISILDSKIKTGDDCISVGDGSNNVHVTGVSCGPGHGISIGSLGKYKNEEPVNGIFVKKCSLSDTLNGLRIKTWPAAFPNSATDIHFEDITMKNVGFPIIVDQEYCPWGECNKKLPSRVKLSKISFKNVKGTSSTVEAVKLICSSGLPCEDVELDNIDLTFKGGKATSLCSNVDPKLSGTQNPPLCSTKHKA